MRENPMTLTVTLPHTSYDIIIERGALPKAGEILNLNRRVLIVTDSGVPENFNSSDFVEVIICLRYLLNVT